MPPRAGRSFFAPLAAIATSIGLLVPCFWQRIVAVGDLQSHLYNAWLALRIENGQAPGLVLKPQGTNVLMDVVLDGLLHHVSVGVAERIVAAGIVLVFFWGSFRFLTVVLGEPPYRFVPWLAVLTYGYIFQLGLLNFYLSTGLVFWAFALTWNVSNVSNVSNAGNARSAGNVSRAIRTRLVLSAPVVMLAFVAHPVPPLWFVAATLYRWIARDASWRVQVSLLGAAVAALYALRLYIIATSFEYVWRFRQVFSALAADQPLLFGWQYAPVGLALVGTIVVLAVKEKPQARWVGEMRILVQVLALTMAAVVLVPSSYRVSEHSTWVGLFAERLSLWCGVLLFAALGATRPRWVAVAGSVAAAYFFFLLHADIGKAARIEARMESLVETLPPDERVVAYVPDLGSDDADAAEVGGIAGRLHEAVRHVPGLRGLASHRMERIALMHLLARACIGRCFDYMNHEPATQQFRIRALPGNPAVSSVISDVYAMEQGIYVTKPTDPPLWAIFRCGSGPADLCMRTLQPGESSRDLALAQ